MGEFNFVNTFNVRSLKDIAHWAGLSIPVDATVVVGMIDYMPNGGGETGTFSYAADRNSALPIDNAVVSRLVDEIKSAISEIYFEDDDSIDFDAGAHRVLLISIESSAFMYGIIFVAIEVHDRHFVMTKTPDEVLLGEIEDRIDSILREGIDEYTSANRYPEIWRIHGALVSGDIYDDEHV